ncbi:MAG: phosphate acyltransferase PlsX [Oscillospiraceae bacterium]|jgi:glycerol-3-phosphate acyltransferase PlsX|nr:phosphate acyltransferase PlsX [Oscillospiraceae bacterium]
MKVIVDAFGGDNAPISVLEGCAMACRDFGASIICTGTEIVLRRIAKNRNISLHGIEIVSAESVISFNDPPTDIQKKHSNCSMAVGLRLLRDGIGDVFISAGSTGALLVGSSLFVGRKPGIKRPAIAALLPSNEGSFLLIDAGANSDCKKEMLEQFAVLGCEFMAARHQLKSPRVGLLNIGSEPIKGNKLLQSVFATLEADPQINFVGNIEPTAALCGACDVLVADGFCGNIFLKSVEAASSFIFTQLKKTFVSSILNKLAALKLKSSLNDLRQLLNPADLGGALLVGLKKPVLKAPGNSNEIAIKNTIAQGIKMIGSF